MDYSVWKADPTGTFATLTELENVEDAYELKRGIPRAEGFPDDARFSMDPAFPKDIRLADCVYNLDGLPVVSARLRAVVEALRPPHCEFLPVTILNHKGRVASDDYHIVHPVGVVDCIDVAASEIEWNAIDPELISACFRLMLDPARVDPERVLFRPRFLPTIVLVRGDVAEGLASGGFTGLRLVEASAFEL